MKFSIILKKTCLLLFPFIFLSCATSILKGVNKSGQPVYLGTTDIAATPAFKALSNTPKDEVHKILYLMARLKDAKDLSYLHEGSWYNSLQAFRGGMWLLRNRYETDQTVTDFIRKHVWRSEGTGQRHLVKYPDGSLQDGYYVLLNELALLEASSI